MLRPEWPIRESITPGPSTPCTRRKLALDAPRLGYVAQLAQNAGRRSWA